MNSPEFGGIDPSFSPAFTDTDAEVLSGRTEALDEIPSVAVHLRDAIVSSRLELDTRLASIAARLERGEISPEEADQEEVTLRLIDLQGVRSHIRSVAAYYRDRDDEEEIEEPEED